MTWALGEAALRRHNLNATILPNIVTVSRVSGQTFVKNYITMKHQFKTNINCSGCVAAVTPFLNEKDEIKSWEVNTANPDKILTVETEALTAEEVSELVRRAGYKSEPLA